MDSKKSKERSAINSYMSMKSLTKKKATLHRNESPGVVNQDARTNEKPISSENATSRK